MDWTGNHSLLPKLPILSPSPSSVLCLSSFLHLLLPTRVTAWLPSLTNRFNPSSLCLIAKTILKNWKNSKNRN